MNKTCQSPRYSTTDSLASRFSAFSLETTASTATSLRRRRFEAIFTIDGVSHDVMLEGQTLIWRPVENQMENNQIDTYEVDLLVSCLGLRIRKVKRLRTCRALIAGFNLALVDGKGVESSITFNNEDATLVEQWAGKILRQLRKRPLGRFKVAKLFVESEDTVKLAEIVGTLKASGLKIERGALSTFKCLERRELAVLIGSEAFFQHAIEYALPRAALAYVPIEECSLAEHFYATNSPSLSLQRLLLGRLQTSCALVIKFKHLDGNTFQRKAIHLRIEPTVLRGYFALEGSVTIDDAIFNTQARHVHFLTARAEPSAGFRVKLKVSGQKHLITRAMVKVLPDAVAQSLSTHMGSSTFHAGEFKLKTTDFTGDYRITLGGIEYERTADLRSIQITGDPDINFVHFTS